MPLNKLDKTAAFSWWDLDVGNLAEAGLQGVFQHLPLLERAEIKVVTTDLTTVIDVIVTSDGPLGLRLL